MMNNGREVDYFCLGCTVGVALAVLFAPKSGEETVAYLQRKANEGADYAKQTIDEAQGSINEVVEHAKRAVNDQSERLSAAVNAGKQAYRNAGQSAT